jgi:hypothetical protein
VISEVLGIAAQVKPPSFVWYILSPKVKPLDVEVNHISERNLPDMLPATFQLINESGGRG